MPKKPNKKQIDAEIKRLKKMKPTVRHKSIFGDDNHASIDAQVDVLEQQMSEDDIYDKYEPLDEEGEPDYEANRSLIDNALEARRWLDGESEDGPPSKGWEDLVDNLR